MNSDIINTQITIVGGGGAGLAAAVAAREKGVDVTLIEELSNTGGNTQFAFGMFAAESPVQKRLNMDAPRDEFFRMAMDYAQWTIDARIIRTFIDKSGDTIGWLEEKGVVFDFPEKTRTYFKLKAPYCWHCPQGLGAGVTKALTRRYEELGGRLLFRTKGEEITRDDKGEINGILAINKEGKKLVIKTKSVILATGGYGANEDLLSKYCPYYDNTVLYSYPVKAMGDGLKMATSLGADTIGMGKLHMEPKGFKQKQPRQMLILASQPYSIWLDKKGNRFVDEATYITRGAGGWQAIVQLYRLYRDYTNYTLFDEGILQYILSLQEGAEHYLNLNKEAYNTSKKELSDILEQASKQDCLKISDSLVEIAKWMDINPETLQANLDEYNKSCDNKHDEIFVKDPEFLLPMRTPPYYALKCTARFLNPMGGIKINHKMEVLDFEGNPIRGLYAAGIDTGGWEGDASYNILLNGTYFSFAINSGRIAAENATNYIQSGV